MLRPTLFKRFLFPSLLLALAPLLAVSVLLYYELEQVNRQLAQDVALSADRQASATLLNRTRQVAESVSAFLYEREQDVRILSGYAHDRRMLRTFYAAHNREVWELRNGKEQRRQLPLYRSITLIDAHGQELLEIRNNRFTATERLRHVARPEQTEYKNETYFHEIKTLKPGQIYVSRVTGRHLTIAEQRAGKQYDGVIRFGAPLFTPDGAFDGALILSLDHRHLLEFTQHIDPGPGYRFAEPDYTSANYAFMFDDEGWMISHPKFWDIRGVDRNGREVPAYTEHSSASDIAAGRIPFNLDRAGFIHPNYPRAAAAVRRQHSGVVETTNVGGSRKIMAYAPIIYSTGSYRTHGIFGGVTIGLQMDQYTRQAGQGSRMIDSQLRAYRHRSAVVMLLAALLAGLAAWRLARGIIKPIQKLNLEASHLAAGDSAAPIAVSGSDELAQLTETFNHMASELELRKQSLINTLEQLEQSRQEILDERNFKESILESISSAITTFSPEGLLTSRNHNADRFLGQNWPIGSHYSMLFTGWGDLPARIARAFSEGVGYGRESLTITQEGTVRHFDVGIFPIGPKAEMGLTVTLRDETLREGLRDEATRLDRLASLGKLAAGISHEIRNPLTGISLLLDDLHDRASLTDTERTLLRKALDEIERIERLTSSLLSFAAPPKADFREARLDQLLQEVAFLLQRTCRSRGIALTVICETTPTILLDPDKIRQAVLNLLKNALEALPDQGMIELRLTGTPDGHRINICDNGPGIPADDLPLIFEPFFTRKGAGTGLGLSITKRIVEEHDGSLEVHSSPGSGTCFTISLPCSANPH